MRNLFILICFFIICPAWADIQLLKVDPQDPVQSYVLADEVIRGLSAVPKRGPHKDVGLRVFIDDAKYYVQPAMFMAKIWPDEVCTYDVKNYRSYKCVEGQPDVDGCHLLFFNTQGESVGFQTMKIDEKYPHFCNAMPAMGVADKAKNELLITMQYFVPEAHMGVAKLSELGRGWTRMTSLIRVRASNGKIEVEQDDSCLGNPNQFDTIAKARKQLQRCAASQK